MFDDTICAPATAPVHSPIGIIRISGPATCGAVDSLFRPSGGLEPRRVRYGAIIDGETPVDDVILVWYRSPKSYTGEDMAEIFCHGNPLIIRKILRLLDRRGVRMAEPGEFTRRAFLNGKTDLTGAEAIGHIIAARSEWEIETSLRQMHGALRDVIRDLRGRIIDLKADFEARIDFPEEDVAGMTDREALAAMEGIRGSIDKLIGRCRTGERLSHGIDITIAGKPNVGKSSILNLLLNQERAIVSSIPGTTRDVIREPLQIGGLQVNLADTAGIDTPGDEIEKIGIDMSRRRIESSPVILAVLDATTGITGADTAILDNTKDKNRIIIINKTDVADPEECARMRDAAGSGAVLFSALTGAGLTDLRNEIERRIRGEFVEMENSFIADIRVITILESAAGIAEGASRMISDGGPAEIIAFELQGLISTIAEITGEITPDDVLDSIFSRFCIGK